MTDLQKLTHNINLLLAVDFKGIDNLTRQSIVQALLICERHNPKSVIFNVPFDKVIKFLDNLEKSVTEEQVAEQLLNINTTPQDATK